MPEGGAAQPTGRQSTVTHGDRDALHGGLPACSATSARPFSTITSAAPAPRMR